MTIPSAPEVSDLLGPTGDRGHPVGRRISLREPLQHHLAHPRGVGLTTQWVDQLVASTDAIAGNGDVHSPT